MANRQSLSGYEKTQRRPIKRAVKTSHVAEHSLRPELTVVPLEAIRKRIREDLGERRGHAPKNVHKNICRTPSTKRSSAVTGGTCSGPVSQRFFFFFSGLNSLLATDPSKWEPSGDVRWRQQRRPSFHLFSITLVLRPLSLDAHFPPPSPALIQWFEIIR